MRNSKYYRIHILYILHQQTHSIKPLCFLCICLRICYNRSNTIFLKFFNNINNLSISCIRAILLKCKSKYRNLCILNWLISCNKILTQFSATYFPISSFIRLPERMILTVISKLLCLICKIIRIYTYAMTSYKSRDEIKEIPLCSCCFKNSFGINSHLVENDGKLIHKGNIDISLAVLYNLCCFSNLDGLSSVNTCFNN